MKIPYKKSIEILQNINLSQRATKKLYLTDAI